MKVYIRRIGKIECYKSSTEWTPVRDEARDFGTSLEALACVQKDGLQGCEILLAFGDPNLDVTLSANGREHSGQSGNRIANQSR